MPDELNKEEPMRILKLLAVLLLASTTLLAQTTAVPQSAAKIPTSFDVNALDKSINPCTDFYQFACGGWRAANPIPSDKSRWGRFNELAEYNLNQLHDILERTAASGKHSAIEKKIGDFYGACMDEKTVESLGAKPLAPYFGKIDAIKTKEDLIKHIAYMQQNGMNALFAFGSAPDLHDANQTIPNVDQGGLTLPDRDYYIKEDAKSVETRQKYLEHVQKMFELLGDKPDVAAAEAKTVLGVETGLAKVSMDRVSRRDPKNRDHRMKVAALQQIGPNFTFTSYFAATGAPKFDSLNVGNPDFFKAVNAQIESVQLADWKTYLRWKTLRATANELSSAFVDENFNFNGMYMGGAKELEARWKRCTRATDADLGEALGRLYVEKTFGADGKERSLKMIRAIEAEMGKDIDSLDWMSEDTKKEAHKKLASIVNNIGYPDKWRDYSTVEVKRNDYLGNDIRATMFEVKRNYNKIDKPTDKKEWGMTPPTVNAYYRGAMNDINFPAGILQPPFFSRSVDDAVNFGGIGVVIGHELTHGFDDQGRKFDAVGNLRDWWTEKDGKEFETRANCIADQYSNYVAVKDDKGEVKLNGKLTLGENTADNGGLRLAYMALMSMLGDKVNEKKDGFSAAQRFFIGYGQIWCQNQTEQIARQLAITDPHSPGQYRVNGVISNSPFFKEAFGCRAGDPMVRENTCRVW
jgi:putative endopeptidase